MKAFEVLSSTKIVVDGDKASPIDRPMGLIPKGVHMVENSNRDLISPRPNDEIQEFGGSK